jgi:hypothetical protein
MPIMRWPSMSGRGQPEGPAPFTVTNCGWGKTNIFPFSDFFFPTFLFRV